MGTIANQSDSMVDVKEEESVDTAALEVTAVEPPPDIPERHVEAAEEHEGLVELDGWIEEMGQKGVLSV